MRDEPLFACRRFEVVCRTLTGPDGREQAREIIRHPGAAVVLPLLDDGRIVLIDNFRPPAARRLLELPAGTLDADEAPIDAARRELAEETGYRAGSLEPLARFYSSPGILDEVMHLFVATRLEAGSPDLQEGEDIRNVLVSWDEALAMVADGRIEDAKTLVALLLYARSR